MSEPRDRDTDAPFGQEEVDQIRGLMASRAANLNCPRCGGPLQSGTPVVPPGGSVGVFIVRCPACRRAFMASPAGPG